MFRVAVLAGRGVGEAASKFRVLSWLRLHEALLLHMMLVGCRRLQTNQCRPQDLQQ